MAKPTIVTRTSKGTALTWAEGDANLTNLQNATISIQAGTGGTTVASDLNGTVTLVAGTNVTITGDNTAKTVTIAAGGGGGIALTSLSVTDTGGDGSLSYNNTTGVFTYTGPSAAEVRAHISAGTGISITNGQISSTVTAGISDLVQDTTPQLGGALDVNGNSIVSASNGNINIAPNGTGQTIVKNLEYNEFVHALGTTSGTVAPNVANGNVQTITLNGNLILNAFTSPVAGQSLTLIVNTGGTGRTLTSSMKFAGGTKTLSTTNTTDIISIFYDGTTYFASLSTDFK